MWDLKDYRYANSAAEAVALMRRGPGRGLYIAGGTDLFQAQPADCDFVVDINGAGLGGVARTPDGGLYLGATASLEMIARSGFVHEFAGGTVAVVAQRCGNRPVRTVGTIGGNLCHGLPSADMAPILLALDARVHFTDGRDKESLPLNEFFLGPHRTILGGRLLLGVELPPYTESWQAGAKKLSRTAEDISLVHVAVAMELNGPTIQAARIALGAVAPTPVRAVQAEESLVHLDISSPDAHGRFAAAAELAVDSAQPVDDQRASADYRCAMVEIITRRLLDELATSRDADL
jgi:carbon-monoxide dehydrogenase medium subunit